MAIGATDYSGGNFGTGAVSLGSGGRIVLRFIDNKLTGSDSNACVNGKSRPVGEAVELWQPIRVEIVEDDALAVLW